MFSLLVTFLGDTVDNGYLEMFCSIMICRKEIYTWVRDANAVILRHSSTLFYWGGPHLQKLGETA